MQGADSVIALLGDAALQREQKLNTAFATYNYNALQDPSAVHTCDFSAYRKQAAESRGARGCCCSQKTGRDRCTICPVVPLLPRARPESGLISRRYRGALISVAGTGPRTAYASAVRTGQGSRVASLAGAATLIGLLNVGPVTAATPATRLSTRGIPAATQRAFDVFDSHPGPHVRPASSWPQSAALLDGVHRNPFGEGADIASARVVAVRPGITILVLAGPHGICVGTEMPAGPRFPGGPEGTLQCGSTENAERAEDGGTSGGRIAYGIVPNGNHTATIKTGGGRQVTTRVVANVYYVTGLLGDRGITLPHP